MIGLRDKYKLAIYQIVFLYAKFGIIETLFILLTMKLFALFAKLNLLHVFYWST
jgi:hypothetical protein